MASFLVGTRDLGSAFAFISDLARRLRDRVQFTTDGHRPYLSAVEDAFGGDIDYAMLQKLYGADPAGERRYSPAQCIGTRRETVVGDPDPKHVIRRVPEPHDEEVDAPAHAVDQRLH